MVLCAGADGHSAAIGKGKVSVFFRIGQIKTLKLLMYACARTRPKKFSTLTGAAHAVTSTHLVEHIRPECHKTHAVTASADNKERADIHV